MSKRLVEIYFCLAIQSTRLWTKNLFHYTTVIVQKNPDFNRTLFSINKTWIQLTAKPNFELKRQTFLPLHIPAAFQRSICDSLEGLCVLLRRTSYLCRFSDMIQCFARQVSVLSLISNEVTDFIYDNHCDLVAQWNRDILSWVALQQCAETISRKGSLLNNWFGFIDAPEIFIASISLRKSTKRV